MDIREMLLSKHSKEITLAITDWIGNDPERFAQLMELFLSAEYRVVQRASWVVSHVGSEHPNLFKPHFKGIVAALQAPLHPAVMRNVMKVLADTEIEVPEEEEGILVDLAFKWLMSTSTPVAIQAHSMTWLAKICKKYPELGGELKEVLETQMEYGSAGFCSRARKIMKEL